MIGKKLEHGRFGHGIVQNARHKGLELYVQFEDGIGRWVRIEDVEFLSTSPVLEVSRPYVSGLTEEELRSRSMVEAFRLGIVPHGCVDEFTFGRDEEIQFIKQWLEDEDTGTLIVEGEYGSGKTHLLDYLYALVLKQGYAAAMVTLDPFEVPLFKPKAVYRRLIQSLCYIDGSERKGFRDFMRALAGKGQCEIQAHEYLGEAISRLKQEEDPEWLWNWIEGRESWWYPPLYDHGTAANIYCYILSGIAWAARNVLGLKGLVVIMDEAESVDPGWYYSRQVSQGFNFVKGLLLLAGNDSTLEEEVEVRSESGGKWFGMESGLIYHGRTVYEARGQPRVPYCFRLPSFLKVVFAFTPNQRIQELENYEVPLRRLRLQPLSELALKDVFDHVCLLYDSCYGFLETDDSIQRCFETIKDKAKPGTRAFVKGSVEVLDLRRFHPHIPLDQYE
jgi:hypothetical protein